LKGRGVEGAFPTAVLVAIESLKSRSDRAYGFEETIPNDRNPVCALSVVGVLTLFLWKNHPKFDVKIFLPS
jgi:hypothetical protein